MGVRAVIQPVILPVFSYNVWYMVRVQRDRLVAGIIDWEAFKSPLVCAMARVIATAFVEIAKHLWKALEQIWGCSRRFSPLGPLATDLPFPESLV